MPDKGEGRTPRQHPALHTGGALSPSTGSIPDRPDVPAAELIALARGELPACQCCTPAKRRRDALARLHAQDQIVRIAAAFLHLNRPDPAPELVIFETDDDQAGER